jgi:acyl-CoA hydrolase
MSTTLPTTVTADEAVDRLRAIDTVAVALATGQPPAFIEALGRRDDWAELRVYGAILMVPTAAFAHPRVHLLSAFWGPIERGMRERGLNVGFVPTDFRGMSPLLERLAPRVMATVASMPDAGGWCSLSLHAGAGMAECQRAAADPERLLVVEVSRNYPRTLGLPPEHPHAIHVDDIDVLIESDAVPPVFPDPVPTDVDRAIAEFARGYVRDGATLQTGIGSVPTMIARLIADGAGGGYGVHSEMFTTGLMQLHRAGKVTNHKGQFDGHSITTFAGGTPELYAWLDGNEDVRFLPVEVVNSPERIARNHDMITINAALALDIQGQMVADTIGGDQFSGIGGHEDFVSGPALSLVNRSLVCLPSTVTVQGELRSRIVPYFSPGTVVTTPRHQVDVVITEHGAAELRGKTVRQRGEALAAIAHPDFRDELREAARRASRGRSPYHPEFHEELRDVSLTGSSRTYFQP